MPKLAKDTMSTFLKKEDAPNARETQESEGKNQIALEKKKKWKKQEEHMVQDVGVINHIT